MQLHNFSLRQPVTEMGSVEPELAGIYSPRFSDAAVGRYVHAQFLEHAEHYALAYAGDAHWSQLVGLALGMTPLPERAANAPPLAILDVGCGAGNTVFALLRQFADAQLVATDLSLPLLKVLARQLDANFAADRQRCAVLQMNAEDIVFDDGQFDLVVGGSILHHLLAPELCLRECARVLRPGGYALFFEPFEAGNQVVALLLRQLITLSGFYPQAPLPAAVERFFNALLLDYTTRKDLVPGHHLLPHLDDKWLFSRTRFEELALDAGFAKLQIRSLHPAEQQFAAQLQTLLTIGAGLSMADLPSWALPVIEQFDAQFSPQAKADLMFEGAVVLQR